MVRRARRAFAVAGALCCAAVPTTLVPTPIGVGRAYHPVVGSPSGSAIRGMPCTRVALPRFGVHLEALRQPSGRPGAGGHRCCATTHVVRRRRHIRALLVPRPDDRPDRTDPGRGRGAARARRSLRHLGRKLGLRRLIGFHGVVRVYVNGLSVPGDPRLVPLARHAEIVVEVGGYVPPHQRYLFPRTSTMVRLPTPARRCWSPRLSVLVSALVLAVAAVATVPPASADGDPASDYLWNRSLYVPTGTSPNARAHLQALSTRLAQEGCRSRSP